MLTESPRVFVAGSGRQSVAAGFDLVRSIPDLSLTLADASIARARAAADRIAGLHAGSSIECMEIDASDVDAMSMAMEGHDIALAGVPYQLNPAVHKAARGAAIPSVDMGSDVAAIEEALGPRDGGHSTVAVFDSGLAPGLGNQLARMLIEELDAPIGAKILCGGLPLQPRTPLKYKPRFSLEGLIGEYSDPAVALREGVVVELESLSYLETVDAPEVGELEAFVTSGGASIGPQLWQGKLETYEYKTLRFPGHCEAMKSYRDKGMWKEENFAEFAKLFEELTANEDERDQIVLIVEAWSKSERKRLHLRQIFDERTGLSAMEQLTGYSTAIVLRKALETKLKPGLYAAEEVVSGSEMLRELAQRGISAREF